jgi:hypothetical protein
MRRVDLLSGHKTIEIRFDFMNLYFMSYFA